MEIPTGQVVAMVLGIMQDAGLPQAGCRCPRCSAAFENQDAREFVTALAIIDTRRYPAGVWLIDATPDIKDQLNLLSDVLGLRSDSAERLRQPDGLFLTHAHMGHTAGLVHFGPEAMNVKMMPVYAPDGLVKALLDRRLWQPLINRIELISLKPGHSLSLSSGLVITPIPVPHGVELVSGTFAYHIKGPSQSLLYLPDIDDWGLWPEALETVMAVDVALVDASFYSRDELSGRNDVAHPLISDTLAFFSEIPGQLVLTHFNHTNPVLDTDSQARRLVEASEARIAYTGQLFRL